MSQEQIMLVICLDWLLFHPHLDICSYSSYIYINLFIFSVPVIIKHSYRLKVGVHFYHA